MNCIRCQAPLRKQMATEVGMPLASCISCRGLWFEKDEIRLALRVKSLGKTDPKATIGFQCPKCTNADLYNYFLEGVQTPIISCRKCLGAWIDGGQFGKIKQSIQEASTEKDLKNPLYTESVTVSVPENILPTDSSNERDWIMVFAVGFFICGIGAFAYVLLKYFGILN